MRRHGRASIGLAMGLAMLAGYIDAIGFLRSGGLFVSFMSGNSTRMAVGIAADLPVAGVAAAIIAAFFAGVMGGTAIAEAAGMRRKPAVLLGVALLLGVAALARDVPSLCVLAAAMGALNATFMRDGEVSIGVTYMTGTLVKTGQHLARALMGRGAAWAWLPFAMLWAGLVTGAVLGAEAQAHLSGGSLWLGAGAAFALVAPAILIARRNAIA